MPIEDLLQYTTRSYLLFFYNLLSLSSRPERHVDLSPTRNQWRGVEGSRGTIPEHAATGRSFDGLSSSSLLLRNRPGLLREPRQIVSQDLSVVPPLGENSLKRYGKGYCLGIPPLRATDFLKRTEFRWRSGRDDRGKKALMWLRY